MACKQLCLPLFSGSKREMRQVTTISGQILLLNSTPVFSQSLALPSAHLAPFNLTNKVMEQPLQWCLGFPRGDRMSPRGRGLVNIGIEMGGRPVLIFIYFRYNLLEK